VSAADPLQLVAMVDSDADTSSMSFVWSCDSDSSMVMWSSAVIDGIVNTSVLLIKPNVLQGSTTYTFSVRVVDKNPLHRTRLSATGDASVRTGSAAATVKTEASMALVGQMDSQQSGTSPCDAQNNPCMFGGKCSFTTRNNEFTVSCACPQSPVRFYGPRCGLAVVSCTNCTSSYKGGRPMMIYGVGFHSLRGIKVSNVPVWSAANGLKLVNLTSTQAQEALTPNVFATLARYGVATLQTITFRSPAIHVNETFEVASSAFALPPQRELLSMETLEFAASGSAPPPPDYEVMTLQSLTAGADLNLTSQIFYTYSQCLQAGQWRDDDVGGCLLCPMTICRSCPGGGRCVPAAGYWSSSAMQTPVACTHPANCQGEEGTCSTGYDGPLCEYCASGYYTQAGQCLPCGDSTDQRGQIISALVAACVVMAVLGGLVAFLASMNLALAVSSFLVLQQLAMVGLDGSKELPVYRTEVGRVFTWLNLSQYNQTHAHNAFAVPSG
jgi:hypothetical protein